MKKGGDFEQLSMVFFTIFARTNDMKKIRSGYLLEQILDRSTNKTMSQLSPDRSLWIYFAHDDTIADLLSSPNLYEVRNLNVAFRKNHI